MHFEILVEGQSDNTALSILMPKMVGSYKNPHTWRIHPHRGLGVLPSDLCGKTNTNDVTLLHNLAAKLRAYGRASADDTVVVVLVDLDDRADCRQFKQQLMACLTTCDPPPRCLFRIAIRELESWFLGDLAAIQSGYPSAGADPLLCVSEVEGGWAELAHLILPPEEVEGIKADKRSARLTDYKRDWAKRIAPFMEVESNRNLSFQHFRDGLRCFAASS
ncbi:MAG: DUF4276 family protein [Magnetococcales bacterium]|nr:DUF4276 family protein [Magnetococcales bacterium]MBF0115617.1 DUF4276 family protein [Magnetococcales bacterium]